MPDGSAVLVASFGSDQVCRIETATVTATIAVGGRPGDVAGVPARRR